MREGKREEKLSQVLRSGPARTSGAVARPGPCLCEKLRDRVARGADLFCSLRHNRIFVRIGRCAITRKAK